MGWTYASHLHFTPEDNHASTSSLSFLMGRMPFLPPNQQHQSTEGIQSTEDTIIIHKNDNSMQCSTCHVSVIKRWIPGIRYCRSLQSGFKTMGTMSKLQEESSMLDVKLSWAKHILTWGRPTRLWLADINCWEMACVTSLRTVEPYLLTYIPVSYTHLTLPTNREV